MAMPLRPLHFLSREDGTLTALVAVDELPHYISIRGVPRTLNHSDTQGMTSLGTVKSRGQFYLIDNAIQHPSKPVGEKANNSGRQVVAGRGPEDFGQLSIAPPNSATDPSAVQNPDWTPVTTGGSQTPSKHNSGHRHGKGSQNGNSAKKEYCSFWLRHGECDYQQQGCIFKHEMPTDKPTLDKLGLRDIPRWYREKHGVKGLGGTGGRNRHEGNGRNWRAENHHHTHQHPPPAAANSADRRDVHGHRVMTTEAQVERPRATPTPPQQPNLPGLPHGHPTMYNNIPNTTHLPPMGLPAPGGLNMNLSANNPPLEVSKFPNRCDLISIDDFRKTPTPDHMVQDAAKSALGNFAGNQPHAKVDLMDQPYSAAPGLLPTVRATSSNGIHGQHAMSHSNIMLSHSYDTGSLPLPGSASLWTMAENEGDNWNLLPLTPFLPVGGTPINQQPNGQGVQIKKKPQRSRRLYQRRQSINGNNGTDEEKHLRVTNVPPINTVITNLDFKGATSRAISPCFSPHPQSGSYASSPCSPRSGLTTSRFPDNLDFRGNGNHRYGSRGSPNSTQSTHTNRGINCDLFDLGLNNPITLTAKPV
ncbi:C-x8-C-x5-C-x3-H type zinc finger protein [Nannizzia gypsea CBS 118893]|uniref:C-x8-C-x5-C-x3-H type zinc finger protein n=1 Tax=Arthroderma gypseum (strain ATCC MYA-4604 / CBS 118893) TaxID=535722 RepID=E5R2Z1_ARTGP|nr:C-x8-C-x5-C-x3-H type zinc finger protein [Nannizzia gypsea CBS 118893]EFQ97912.1 C-x8-C-x5-C-x3-H type zinc finger protein [Nannizzia gypsea CBS 118893]